MENFLRSKGLKEKSIKTYLSVINKVISKLDKEFTEKQLEDYLTTLKLSPSTYNLYRAVMNFYTKRKLGYEIKFSKAKQNKFLPIEVTKEEFNQFLSTIPNQKHILGFKFMYESGLRVDEVIKLKKHDLQLDKLTVRVRGKGNKDRYTILNKTLVNQINNFLLKLDKNNPYIFQNGKGHITERTFQERLKKARQDSKLDKKFSCHSFRHSFAINLVNDGVDIQIVQKMMGHASLRTTQIYLECRTINLTRIAERLSSKLPDKTNEGGE
jgi:site-specific recombinase XerD